MSHGFWHPFDARPFPPVPAHLAERFSLRAADDAARRRDAYATTDGLRRYVESELAALPAGWHVIDRRGARLLWHLQPPTRQNDECGHDLVLLPDARLFLLTHSNHRAGDWHVERIVAGTTANVLEVEALVRFAFELRDFVCLVTDRFPQNLDSPT